MNNELFFGDNEFIVSKTDMQGKITYGNALFIKMSGYSEKELLGAPHNILRHADMPRTIFKLLWDYVKSGKEIKAFVKNRTKNGDFYWVEAQVTPSFDESGRIIGYHSVRRKPRKDSVSFFSSFYKELLAIEAKGGVDAGVKHVQNILDSKGVDYEQFIVSF